MVPEKVRAELKRKFSEILLESSVQASMRRNLIGNAYIITVFIGDPDTTNRKLVLMTEPTSNGKVRFSMVNGQHMAEDIELDLFLATLRQELSAGSSGTHISTVFSEIFGNRKAAG